MTYRGLSALVEGFIRYRWVRIVLALIFTVIAIPITWGALAETDIKMNSNVRISDIAMATDTQTGVYLYTRITVEGSNAYYIFYQNDFTPPLSEPILANSDIVNIWYDDSPIEGTPRLVALQTVNAQGALGPKYVTDQYLHAADIRNRELVPTGILLLLAVITSLSLVLIPAPTKSKSISQT